MLLEEFSAGYWLAPTLEVIEYGGKWAIVQDDVFDEMVAETGLNPPIASVGGGHFEIYPDRQIPEDYLAIPRDVASGVKNGDAVLISKQNGREFLTYE
ncbi:hypothetical protein HSR121_2054 [Halapricum desulfuricans]|uniref:Uncharacterized protein n=2 Tax=Halapricum desulfuricans TaxID=2841257 RepID=A0A897N7L7_9EURY|nr:hypothetical protein HSR121_2054 [Halapricum desulfuricans]